MMIWLYIAIYVTIILLEVPALLKGQRYRDLGAFLAVFIIGLYMSLAFYYHWPLQAPFELLMKTMGES